MTEAYAGLDSTLKVWEEQLLLDEMIVHCRANSSRSHFQFWAKREMTWEEVSCLRKQHDDGPGFKPIIHKFILISSTFHNSVSPWTKWNCVLVFNSVQTTVFKTLFVFLGARVHLEFDESLRRLSQKLFHNIIILKHKWYFAAYIILVSLSRPANSSKKTTTATTKHLKQDTSK